MSRITRRCLSDSSTYGQTQFHQIWVAVIVAWYFVWEWSVIGLYIRKCHQFWSRKQGQEIVQLRIKFILSKILMLTIFIELSGSIIIVLVDVFENSLVGVVCYCFLVTWDGCFVAYIMYLMLSHNDDEYFELIKLLNKIKVCICFKCFINQGLWYLEKSISKNLDLHQDKVKEKMSSSDVTYPDHVLPKKMQDQYSTTVI